MEKVWEIKDPESYAKGGRKRRKERPVREEKDPATAYSRSVIVWGAGQNYNGEYGKSLAFTLLMIAVLAGAGLAVFFRVRLLHVLQAAHLSLSGAFLAGEVFLLCILLFWIGNASDAYRVAKKTLRSKYPGTSSRIFPALCSLILPGWGQFLNGQPWKGAVLSACGALGIFSFLTVPAVLRTWPLLEPTTARFVIESIFAVSVLTAPLLPILWLFAFYDALRISLDAYKKEPLWERIKAANNRRKTQGWVRGVFPWIGRLIALALVLTLLIAVIYQYFPAGFYRRMLMPLQSALAQRGMVILPELAAKLLHWMPGT